VLHTMLYPDEIVAASDVDGLPVRVKADDRELKKASQLIESLTVKWDPKRYGKPRGKSGSTRPRSRKSA
jgi:DNA end-binding protein Ku